MLTVVSAESVHRVSLSTQGNTLSGNPGSSLTYTVRVTNEGLHPEDEINLGYEVCDSCNAWIVSLSKYTIEDLPGRDSEDIEVYVTVPSSASTDEAVITINAKSRDDATAFANLNIITIRTCPEGTIKVTGSEKSTCCPITPSGSLDCGTLVDGETYPEKCPQGDVVIPEGVTTLLQGAISYCINITSVTLPTTLTDIESHAIGECKGLRHVVFQSEPSMTQNSFGFSDGIITVSYPGNKPTTGYQIPCTDPCVEIEHAPNLVDINGVLCPVVNGEFGPCCPTGDVVIPAGVNSLAEGAFDDCSGITSVTFPDSLLEIKKDAFRIEDPLIMVDLSGTGLTTIGDDAFKNAKIATLRLPSTLTSVDADAFNDARIESVEYPGGEPAVVYLPKDVCGVHGGDSECLVEKDKGGTLVKNDEASLMAAYRKLKGCELSDDA